jgi:hypothetical protein
MLEIMKSGLLAGLVINIIDVPNSIFFAAPKLEKHLNACKIVPSRAMPAYFVVLHFVLGIALVWLFEVLKSEGLSFNQSVFLSWFVIVGLNRLFGFGNVLIGILPGSAFWGFSWAFVIATYAGTWIGASWLV